MEPWRPLQQAFPPVQGMFVKGFTKMAGKH